MNILLYDAIERNTTSILVGLCVGGSKRKIIGTIHAIKYQVYCIGNTVQWSANTVQLVCVNNPP